jgi:hypothetical protein
LYTPTPNFPTSTSFIPPGGSSSSEHTNRRVGT